MRSLLGRPSTRRLVLVGTLTLPLTLHAQTPPPAQESDWQRANGVVGALPRGHIDALQWEQAHMPVAPLAPASTPGLAVEEAVHKAWRFHPELAEALARLGDPNVQRLAKGDWAAVDPSLQRRIEHADEVLAVARQSRKAWIEAVAAQQVVQSQRDMLEAAQAASALGQRMVTVGNWSKLQLAQVQLGTATARMNLRRAQYAAERARNHLHKLLGAVDAQSSWQLPMQLPPVPAQTVTPAELHARGERIRQQLPLAEQWRNQRLLREAESAYRTAHALVQDSQEEQLQIRALILEETVLHYNGMLKSVWELLDETRNQSQAMADAIAAQRDFWLAEADLQWVLQGGEPDSFIPLGGAGSEAPSTAAH